MKRSDRAKARKKKQREERLRRERHARASAPRQGREDDGLDDDEEELPPGAAFLEERALRRVALLDAAREDGRVALADEELDRQTEEELGALAEELVRADPRERAQELAFEALETVRRKEARALARAALELDPDCIDALATLAQVDARDDEDALVRLEAAVEAGARALGGEPFFERNRGRFWTLYETRPYVRARERLAELLRAAGRVDEAILHYEALLDLDREDGLAVRHALVGALLERGELVKARRWLDHEEDRQLATPAWARALERFLSGDRVGAARAVRAGRERNRYVESVLLGTAELPSDLRGFTPGRPSEALEVELRLGDAWRASAEAFDWLDQGATLTTEEQREAAIASYREPVAALLQVGDRAIGGGQGEPDFDRLAPEDIAELERMALDPALHELEADEPAVWAPLHALRILARTRAAESVPVFVALARESEETDEALLDDLTAAFSAAGAAALAPCEALLAERAERISPRKIAAIVLADLARRPELRERALAVLLAGFRNHADEPQRLNDMLALALGTLAPREFAPLLQDAIEQGSLSEVFVDALALENPDED